MAGLGGHAVTPAAVEAAVTALAREVAVPGRPEGGRIADPRRVWELLRARSPEVAKYVVRHYPNPVQAVAGWVPAA